MLKASWRVKPSSRVLFLCVLRAPLLAAAVGTRWLEGHAGAAVHGSLCLEDSVFQTLLYTGTLLRVKLQSRLQTSEVQV